jgi:hypothetical protein
MSEEHQVVSEGWKGGLGNSVHCSCGNTSYGRGIGPAYAEHAYHTGAKERPVSSKYPRHSTTWPYNRLPDELQEPKHRIGKSV